MVDCLDAYGNQPYATSPYGSGEYDGVSPRDIILCYPTVGGGINLSAPITYVPPVTQDLTSVRKIRTLTPSGELFFSDIEVRVGGVYISYHKLWIHNACTTNDFTDVSVEIDPSVDPNGWMSMAPVVNGVPLPLDGNFRNTDGGDGPGAWQTTPLAFPLIPSLGAVAFWIRRRVTVDTDEEQYVTPRFLISGKTQVSGTPC